MSLQYECVFKENECYTLFLACLSKPHLIIFYMHSDYAHFFTRKTVIYISGFLRTDPTSRDLTCYELSKTFHF